MAGEGYKVNGLRNWYHFNNRLLTKYDSIDVQMILVSFFKIPNQKSVNQEKTISFYQQGFKKSFYLYIME